MESLGLRAASLATSVTNMMPRIGHLSGLMPAQEQEANQFAAALLLPERFFKPLCRKKEPSLDLMADLADSFDVSLTATALRYLQFCNEACAVVFSRDGIIQWFRGSKYFDPLQGLYPCRKTSGSVKPFRLIFPG